MIHHLSKYSILIYCCRFTEPQGYVMDGSGLQHTSMEIRKQLRAEEMFF